MGGMRLPPSVHVVLGPSRIVGAGVGLAALGTLAIMFLLPADGWQQAGAVFAVTTWAAAIFWVIALRRGRFAITELRLAPDLVMVVYMGDGRLMAGHVRSSTYVGAWVTSIVWRADGAFWSRAILVVPDMLPARGFPQVARDVALRAERSGAGRAGQPGLSIEQPAALGFALSRKQVQIQRHQRLRQWQCRTIFARVRAGRAAASGWGREPRR